MNLITPIFKTPSLTACFTTRHGGISKTPFDSLNLAFHVNDTPNDVHQNHLLLAKELGYEANTLIYMRQIHSDSVVIVNEMMDFNSPPQCDALITNRPHVPLMVMSADCTPILVYDSTHNAIAAIHAGRAGALNEILPKTLEAMKAEYGTTVEDVMVFLGPSIQGCCYEVNETIARETVEKGYTEALRRDETKVFLDVNTILLQQLHSLGVKKENIEVVNHCTSCQCDTYFSYRADAHYTGRIAGVILLR
ncbi:MAG: peptidoglycan editing factor PgeF [Sulfuricurvum sp.]|nr:peptidoglycan editing factor PgeF [Sulfuricurvum sp.]MDD5386761.1 peptidoglycan editing factor PgeF [Sulfuricurvum sp.]